MPSEADGWVQERWSFQCGSQGVEPPSSGNLLHFPSADPQVPDNMSVLPAACPESCPVFLQFLGYTCVIFTAVVFILLISLVAFVFY